MTSLATNIRLLRPADLLVCLVCSMLMSLLVACGGGGSTTPSVQPIAITMQPSSTSAVAGSQASFSVSASGSDPQYQWQKSTDSGSTWADIAGATSAALNLTADPALNGREYRVVVSNGSNSLTSSAVTLTVSVVAEMPIVTAAPVDQSAFVGASVSFSVTASGSSLAYQWQSSSDASNWTDIAGATTTTLTFGPVTVADNGKSFRVVISNTLGTVNSAPAHLTATPSPASPVISVQPQAQSVLAGQTATFSVGAAAVPAPTFQWQVSTDSGLTYKDVVAATSAVYTTAPVTAADNGKRFRVRISNSQGTLTSSAATLTVGAGVAPAILIHPSAQVAYATDTDFSSKTATFGATASGTPTPAYQWQKSTDGGTTFTNINGATSVSFQTPPLGLSDSGSQYRVVATNVLGTVASHPATLYVADIGIGGVAGGLAINPQGEFVATINSSGKTGTLPDSSVLNGIRVVGANGFVRTLAGSTNTQDIDGTGSAAGFRVPHGIAIDASGIAFVTDGGNRIRKVTPSGAVTSFAGGDALGGFVNGNGALASFKNPFGIAIDAAGNLYVADNGNHAIRKISPSADVTTLAGGSTGGTDGVGSAAKFWDPRGVAVDAAGNVYVADGVGCAIRKVSPAGVVTTIAGGVDCTTHTDGPVATATFGDLSGIAVDGAGNLYVTDPFLLRKITPAGVVSTLPGGSTTFSGQVTVDGAGNVYLSEVSSLTVLLDIQLTSVFQFTIRKVTPDGVVSHFP